MFIRSLWILILFFYSMQLSAENLRVATASNFLPALKTLAALFEAKTAHKILISAGSTGSLYAQIHNGAPFDLFFAADEASAIALVKESRAKDLKIYAQGELVLVSRAKIHHPLQQLKDKAFTYLAIANPKTAPYGLAAMQVLEFFQLNPTIQSKTVTAQNIAQALQYVVSANADMAIVAHSSLAFEHSLNKVILPKESYTPIRQACVILLRSRQTRLAEEFQTFVLSPAAQQLLQQRYFYRQLNS